MTDMLTYSGNVTVKAVPMTKGEFHASRGAEPPKVGGTPGYAIFHGTGEARNEEDGGYVSWLPTDVFDAAYRPFGTWQERLLAEYEDLHNRHALLTEFVNSPGFGNVSSGGQDELLAQHGIMATYASTLAIRIQTAREEGLYDGIDVAPFGVAHLF